MSARVFVALCALLVCEVSAYLTIALLAVRGVLDGSQLFALLGVVVGLSRRVWLRALDLREPPGPPSSVRARRSPSSADAAPLARVIAWRGWTYLPGPLLLLLCLLTHKVPGRAV
ncbi:hypothetical protein [Polyangium fumosum]|uniref:Uncharacterized protein n=1 Tax=Polyangium fumosum TaxID=889272 RepID=A0A4V5PMF6_9BACT|nr:hypothetical protein [Polyangium fumosum]TKD00416.1 hypothetical protein E8A74_34545 [Polyangium fumosum]